MTTYNNVLGVFSYAAHTLANTLWSERALKYYCAFYHKPLLPNIDLKYIIYIFNILFKLLLLLLFLKACK